MLDIDFTIFFCASIFRFSTKQQLMLEAFEAKLEILQALLLKTNSASRPLY